MNSYPDLPNGNQFLRELAEVRENARCVCEECDKERARIEAEIRGGAA